MRFQQLKRDSNAILRKKMYKSGKNWVVKSTLGFVSGLVLFGISQTLTVDADTLNDTTPVSQAVSENKTLPEESKTYEKVVEEPEKKDADIEYPEKDSLQESSEQPTQDPPKQVEQEDTTVSNEEPEEQPSEEPDVSANESPAPDEKTPLATGNWGVNWEVTDDGGEDGITLHVKGGTLKERNGSNMPDIWMPKEHEEYDVENSVQTISIDEKITAVSYMDALFADFTKVKQIKGLELIDMTNATRMIHMFAGCPQLESIDGTSDWNVENVESFFEMFLNDSSLKSVDIKNWNGSSGIEFQRMFYGNSSLESLDFSNLNMKGDISAGLLDGASSIKELTLSPESDLTYSDLDIQNRPSADGTEGADYWQVVAIDGQPVSNGEKKGNDELVSTYDGVHGNKGKVTWALRYVPYFDYKVRYFGESDSVSDEKELYVKTLKGLPHDKFSMKSMSDLGASQETIDKVNSEGYRADYIPKVKDDIALKEGLVIDAPIPKKALMFEINETPVDGGKTRTTRIPFMIGSQEFNEEPLEEVANDRKIIWKKDSEDNNGASVYFYDIYGDDSLSGNIDNDLFKLVAMLGTTDNYDSNGRGLVKAIVNKFKEGGLPEGRFVINLVYEPEEDTNNSSSGGGSSTINKNIEGAENTVGTYKDAPEVQLYDDDGGVITNRKLAPSSDWYSDNIMTLNNVKYYRVATNQWVKADDVYLYYNHVANVQVNSDKIAKLLTASGNKVTNRALQVNSGWYTDRYTYINGVKHYRVATDEFVNENDVQEY
ncbi:BspA family leucine-rich repeat surface protein [Companilactobacillus zhachilii]|uniref:BspA family leucine-rich repeat surface protein n=1 Tax=Companilactobacillus zhachilii TaxID=2304606 RepID=UPI004034DD83